MNTYNYFVLNTHQIFFALLALLYSFLLYKDIGHFKENMKIKYRQFYVLVFTFMAFGLTVVFHQNWFETGMFFSIEFAILITLSVISPKYAVSFFLYLLLSRPWESFDNQLMKSMPRDIFFLVTLVIVGHKIINKEMFIRFNLGTSLIIFFACWVFLSAFFSSNPAFSLNQYNDKFSKSIIIFLLIQNSVKNVSDMLPAKVSLVLAIIEKSIVSFYSTFMLETPKTFDISAEPIQRLESVGILGNSNDIAAIFILVIPFTLFFILNTKLRPFSWIVAIIVVGIMSYLIWLSQSRGAMLALFATIAAYFFLKIKSQKNILLLFLLTLICTSLSFSLMNRKASDVDGSTNNRIIFWKAGANMAIRNPIFGVGLYGFNTNFPYYAIDGNTGSEGKHMTAHSSWVQVVAENGFIGLLIYSCLWLYACYRSYLIRSTDPEYFVSLVGYGVAISFLSHAYLLFPYILLALAITHSFLINQDDKYKPSPNETIQFSKEALI